MQLLRRSRRGYSLVELIFVIGLLVALFSFALPDLLRDIEKRRMPESGRQMRALLTLVRANAMYDGKRYRVRFPQEDEIDSEGGQRQPLIEREDDSFREPGVFNLVSEPWARGETLLRGVRCAEVRLGRPTLESLEEGLVSEEMAEHLEALEGGFEKGFPPLIMETDGTSEWSTFLLTNAPDDVDIESLKEGEYGRLEVILDGITGLCWLQRPFFEEELEMFREHEWPPVLRRDFFRDSPLTEMDVLEISETRVRR